MPIGVTLGDEPLSIIPGTAFTWALAYGVEPSISELTVTAERAERIRLRAQSQVTFGDGRTRERNDPVGPLNLILEDPEEQRRVEVKGIYVVEANRPGIDYNTRTVVLADRRWLWSRTIAERSYNVRRKTGERRLVRGTMENTTGTRQPDIPIQLGIADFDYVYRYETLNNGVAWTAREVLVDLLTELCGESGFVVGDLPEGLDVENLELHGSGASQLAVALRLLPGVRVYVDHNGIVQTALVYDGSEEVAFDTMGAPIAGDYTKVDKSFQRGDFRVYSDIECELRLDHNEGNSATQTTQVKGREDLVIENVILNPLFELDVPGRGVATQGDAITLDEYISAINARPDASNYRLPTIDKKTIYDHWLGNWRGFEQKFAQDNTTNVYSSQRLLLMAALKTHFRQTFQVIPQWMNKIRAIFAHRTAVLNYERATRAPATAHLQWILKFNELGYSPLNRATMSVKNDDYADDLSQANVSPFVVRVLDSDLGIIRIEPQKDQTGLASEYVAGTVDGDLPSGDFADVNVFWNETRLSATYKVAVILTAIKAVPNGIGRLYETKVPLAAAARRLGIETQIGFGPEIELIQGSDTARFAWIDDKAEAIKSAFFDGDTFPEDTMVNPDAIRNLAVAQAASALAALTDRIEGQALYSLKKVEPTGNLRTVAHTVRVFADNSATLTTQLVASGDVPPPDVDSLLPEEIRRKVRNLVLE